MDAQSDIASAILDTALQIANETSWEQLHLHDVAEQLDITLNDVRAHYPQKDDLVEAWFDRADSAMLRAATTEGFMVLDKRDRLHHIIMSWLDALATHKKVTGDMLLYKLEPGHIHLQVLGLLRISRTVQWFREASRQDSAHLLRILEEIGLTSIYLATFAFWVNDHSARQQKTREFLSNRLRGAEACAGRLRFMKPRKQPGTERA